MENNIIIQAKGEITRAQMAFLEFCREVDYGTIEVKVKDGQPVMSKVIEQWRKHDF